MQRVSGRGETKRLKPRSLRLRPLRELLEVDICQTPIAATYFMEGEPERPLCLDAACQPLQLE